MVSLGVGQFSSIGLDIEWLQSGIECLSVFGKFLGIFH